MRGGYLAGVDLGATNVRVVIADQDGNIEARRRFATPAGAPEEALGKMSRAIDELVRGVWVGATVDAVGIAVPGMVDPEAGVIVSIFGLAGWENVPLVGPLGGGQRPVAMENDASAAAVGEGWLGAARGLRHHVFIALGTGIGAGVVVEGRVLRGAHHLGGEIGFLSMTREQVRAGGWNDLEALVGGRAIAAKAVEIFGEGAKASELFEAARAGHTAAAAFVTEIQEYLAMAVVDVIAMLDPEMVVFGGGVMAAQGAWLLDPIRELVHRNTPVRTKMVLSELGEDAQVLGAVRLAGELVVRD